MLAALLQDAFMLRALLVAGALGPLCGLLGVFVTARRMSFFSDTIAHAALAGVAAGFLLGFQEPTLPVLAVCSLVAVTMLWLKEKTELLSDTIMAVLLSTSVAGGLVMLNFLHRWTHLDRYLFGDILTVGPNDVWLAAGVAVGIGGILLSQLNALALVTAHADLAHVAGIPVRALNYAFVLVLTVTVALSIRLLGIVLVTSLIVIPPATARNLAGNLRQQLVLSLLIGLLGATGGVALSQPLDSPTGPTITLTLATLFVLSLVIARFRREAAPLDTPTGATPPAAQP